MLTTLAVITTGLFTGIVTGLTGASGVLVVIPLITLLFAFPIHTAIGTSLLADVIASIPIAYIYYRSGHSDIRAGIWIAIGSILGAQIGAFKALDISGNLLMIAISISMIGLGIKMWVSGMKHATGNQNIPLPKIFSTPTGKIILTVILGFFLGLFTGFFGAGGGLLIFLVLYFVMKLPLKTAIGTSTLIMIITAFSGAVGYFHNGHIDVVTGAILGVSAAVGGVFSAYMANKVNEDLLAKGVGAMFVFLALLMIGIRILHGA